MPVWRHTGTSCPCGLAAKTTVSRTAYAGASPATDSKRSAVSAGHRRGPYPRASRFDSDDCDRSASGEAMIFRTGRALDPCDRPHERWVRLPPLRPRLRHRPADGTRVSEARRQRFDSSRWHVLAAPRRRGPTRKLHLGSTPRPSSLRAVRRMAGKSSWLRHSGVTEFFDRALSRPEPTRNLGVAHSVEHQPNKLGVAGSNPVSKTIARRSLERAIIFLPPFHGWNTSPRSSLVEVRVLTVALSTSASGTSLDSKSERAVFDSLPACERRVATEPLGDAQPYGAPIFVTGRTESITVTITA